MSVFYFFRVHIGMSYSPSWFIQEVHQEATIMHTSSEVYLLYPACSHVVSIYLGWSDLFLFEACSVFHQVIEIVMFSCPKYHRSFTNGKWYCFNDQSVTKVSVMVTVIQKNDMHTAFYLIEGILRNFWELHIQDLV